MTASIRGGIFTMAMLLKGAEVAKALTEGLHAKKMCIRDRTETALPLYFPLP